MSVSVTMALKGTVLSAMVRERLKPVSNFRFCRAKFRLGVGSSATFKNVFHTVNTRQQEPSGLRTSWEKFASLIRYLQELV